MHAIDALNDIKTLQIMHQLNTYNMHFIFHEGLDVEQGQLHVRFFLNPFQIKIGQIDPISNLRGFDLANMSKNSKNITGHTQDNNKQLS